MHARIDPMPSPSWAVRIGAKEWLDDYCAVAIVSGLPPIAYISTTVAVGRWRRAHRRALTDVLWRAGYRSMRWTGVRGGKPVMRTVVLTTPKENDNAEHENNRPLRCDGAGRLAEI